MSRALETLTAAELLLLPRDTTVFIFPVGVLEDHGPHLPLGTDLIEARGLIDELDRQLTSRGSDITLIAMPSLFLGTVSNTTRIALPVRAHVLRDALIDLSQGLVKAGFRHFVCVSGHWGPKQLVAIEEAGKILLRRKMMRPWGKRLTFSSLTSRWITWKQVLSSPLTSDPIEHGGARDTSLVQALRPDLIRENPTGLPERSRARFGITRAWLRMTDRLEGYWGNPARSSGELGSTWVHQAIQSALPDLEAVWVGHPLAYTRFRSGYGWFWPNSSFFKAWVAIFAILTILGLIWSLS